MSRRTLTLLLSTLLAVGLLVGTLVTTVPYIALGPGPTFNTLGAADGAPLIEVQGHPTYADDGHLDLTTVGVRAQLSLAEALVGWVRRDEAVVPRELVYPPGESNAQVDAENAREMTQSQDAATTAALAELKIPVQVVVADVGAGTPAAAALRAGDVLTAVDGTPIHDPDQLRTLVAARPVGGQVSVAYTRGGAASTAVLRTAPTPGTPGRPYVGVSTTVKAPFTVKIALKDVGGPSAGLRFALGIVDKLEPGSLTGGRYIAGTGEITADGTVKPIGGIQQKLRGARGKGATVFLVPADNCRDAAANRPAGLQLVKVASLDDAVRALAAVRAGGTTSSCS